ncbi:helix-turn-helix domain-containing protein [Chitinophaga qingshengii]|uniref:Helix-turn-helix transcriptional regulator n=1 Tax=Chitinophaga qingshengii TaxID=1569794 RepID=A0ABR7TW17_9BACT|nr:AraC family transcriptional regulator [Chitinophaga qingshengii]MBC9934687.1 helix-turn-helix transcriptional regulator [Chitinophaga qingshengii]
MAERNEIMFGKLVYSCAFEKYRGNEEFIPEHFLGFQLSGETHAFHAQGHTIITENTIVLVRKNQLVRTIKYPGKSGKYQFVSISLDKETLHQYAIENKIVVDTPFPGNQKLFFEPDDFLRSYFLSLTPYINKTKEATPKLAILKIREAVELLLQCNPAFKNLLFDFSEPYKIDLEEFMHQNYMFNIPVASFARLTGRSVSTFKRDFDKLFGMTPKRWLLDRRLEEAHYLVKHKQQKPAEFYLDLGFENLSHFYFAFKQKFGVTTSEV